LPENLDAWLRLLEYRHHTAIDLGLDRVNEVWQRMGAPRPGQQVFVVAGTNGKGSTVANICGLLDGLGYSYGSYTTPHIRVYNERIQLGRRNVSDELLTESFERIEAVRGETSLSYFEFGTLAAFDILSRAELDFAVMEIGLGGRLDAVNLLDADCTVITPIGLDHQEYLGSDLYSIGREKAGIVRPSVPLVIGESDPPASVLEIAHQNDAPVYRYGIEFRVKRRNESDELSFSMGDTRLELPFPALPGYHQFGNTATALAAVLQLVPGAADRPNALRAGLESVSLPGRFQQVGSQPLMWIDVGHNALGAAVIADTLRRKVADGECTRVRCVLAMLADKDAESVALHMDDVITQWYTAGLAVDRGQSGEALAERISGVRPTLAPRVCESVGEAISCAVRDSARGDGVLVFGSFFTASEAFQWLQRTSGEAST